MGNNGNGKTGKFKKLIKLKGIVSIYNDQAMKT